MQKEPEEIIYKYKNDSLKIGDLTINVRNCFYPQKNLYDILFVIMNTKLKENPRKLIDLSGKSLV